jgi:micrococcal nuclease
MTAAFTVQSPIVIISKAPFSGQHHEHALVRGRQGFAASTPTTSRSSLARTAFPPISSSSSSSRLFMAKKMIATPPTVWERCTPILTKTKARILSFLGVVVLELRQLSRNQTLILAAVFFLGVRLGRAPPVTQRFVNAVDVSSTYFGPKAPLLKGRVVSVSDGDTFRFLHTPTPFHSSTLQKGQKLSQHSMPIRICTYDTPETPKFGKPGQPYGIEAKEELKNLIGDKMIKIRLLQKDQYGRAVAQVFCGGGKCVDEVMLQQGLGEVYLGMGAVYGPLGKDHYLQLEAEAKKAKTGIWSQGDKRESAAEYKRRTK